MKSFKLRLLISSSRAVDNLTKNGLALVEITFVRDMRCALRYGTERAHHPSYANTLNEIYTATELTGFPFVPCSSVIEIN